MSMDVVEQELLMELEKIDAALNNKALVWYEIRKSLNILRTQNHRYYISLSNKLFMDIRAIYIEQLPLYRLFPHMDRALSLAHQLELRLRKQSRRLDRVHEPAIEREMEIAC